VMVTVPAVAGAVNRPLALIIPASADQVTAELYFPVPCTAALHCDVALVFTTAGLQETATEVMVGEAEEVLLSLLPQPMMIRNTKTPNTALAESVLVTILMQAVTVGLRKAPSHSDAKSACNGTGPGEDGPSKGEQVIPTH
jgi:hypothetical protein